VFDAHFGPCSRLIPDSQSETTSKSVDLEEYCEGFSVWDRADYFKLPLGVIEASYYILN